MIKKTRHYQSELAVIGAGIAGCAATIFALNRGIKTTQIGNTGALAYTSGYFDLLGVDQGRVIHDPWNGLHDLRQHQPHHPYSKLNNDEIRNAFSEFVNTLQDMGLSYTSPADSNQSGLLPVGSSKPTYSMPATMSQSTQAMASRARVLIIDFIGLQGFSAQEIVANLTSQWPQLRAQSISFPDMESGGQVYPEVMARAMEVPATRAKLAAKIKPMIGDAEYIALPAMLGIHGSDQIHQEFQQMIGLPVFEIPTIPPSVAGIRLREIMEQRLAAKGATVITQQKVESVEFKADCIQLEYQDHFGPVVIQTQKLLLASGRFLSGGLKAGQQQIQESLIDLPVAQPDNREGWFNQAYFDLNGHAVNRAGVMVNERFQVIDSDSNVMDQRLFAAGIILAHQDWIRQRCGAGVAIATAFKAVQSL